MQQSGNVSSQNMYKDITTSFMPSLSQRIVTCMYLLTLVTEIEKVWYLFYFWFLIYPPLALVETLFRETVPLIYKIGAYFNIEN